MHMKKNQKKGIGIMICANKNCNYDVDTWECCCKRAEETLCKDDPFNDPENLDVSFIEMKDVFETPDFVVRYSKSDGVSIPMEQQKEYAKEAIQWLEANPKEFSSWSTTGNCFVFVCKEEFAAQSSKYKYAVYFMEIKYSGFAGDH